jgi:hypothetical protein
MRHRVQLGLDQLRQLPLLALQPEGVVGVAGQHLHVELCDHALLAVALAAHAAAACDDPGSKIGGEGVSDDRLQTNALRTEDERNPAPIRNRQSFCAWKLMKA